MDGKERLPIQLQTRSSELIYILNGRNDEYCSILLTILCANYPHEMGFNEIRRHLTTTNPKGKPSANALHRHLDHLIEYRVIQKRLDKASKMKITPVFFSLTPKFVEVGMDLFTGNEAQVNEKLIGFTGFKDAVS
jgi:hypothetical protein